MCAVGFRYVFLLCAGQQKREAGAPLPHSTVYILPTVFMLSRRFHPHDEAHMHRLPNALSPVGVGEMSFSLPPVQIFSPKKEMENS